MNISIGEEVVMDISIGEGLTEKEIANEAH
jgi:hypothetical protein